MKCCRIWPGTLLWTLPWTLERCGKYICSDGLHYTNASTQHFCVDYFKILSRCICMFLFHFHFILQEGTDLAFYIGQIDRKQRPQPFILLMGGSWKKPLQTFVIRKFSLHDAKTENTRKRSLVTVPVLWLPSPYLCSFAFLYRTEAWGQDRWLDGWLAGSLLPNIGTERYFGQVPYSFSPGRDVPRIWSCAEANFAHDTLNSRPRCACENSLL